MIKIINEDIEHKDEILKDYNEQFVRIDSEANNAIDVFIERLTRLKNNITITYLKDEIGAWNFNAQDNLDIPEENEEKDEIIKSIARIKEMSDENIREEIDYIIRNIFQD